MLGSAFDVGLWTILFWIFIGLALGGLLSLLFGAKASVRTAGTTTALGVGDFEGKRVRVAEERTELADQLEAIEGVGPQIAELFHKNKVHRFGQIAAMAPADISKMLAAGGAAFAIARPFTWPFQARLLENGWFAEFLEVGQKLRAGRLPVTGLDGVGDATAERLVTAGVGSVEALADADAVALATKLSETGTAIASTRIEGWIASARALLSGDMAVLAAFFGLPAGVLAARPAATYGLTREVEGRIVNPQALVSALPVAGPVAATATATPSMLPLWLGLGGAALLAILCALGIWCPGERKVTSATTTLTETAVTRAVPADYSRTVAFTTALGTDALFDTSSAALKADANMAIDGRVFEANLKPQLIRIIGHADVRGDDQSNLVLSKDRANAVAVHIREQAAARGLDWSNVAIQAFGAGEEYPDPLANTAANCATLAPTTPEADACYAPDRRVHVTMYVGMDEKAAEAMGADIAK